MAANNYTVAPPRKFDLDKLDEGVQRLILNHTAASFSVEHRSSKIAFRAESPGLHVRIVHLITRYDFKLMRRNLSRDPELEVSITRTLDPAVMQRREWIESGIDEQEYFAKRWQNTATWSSISKTIIVLLTHNKGYFKFVRTTPDGVEEVLETPMWSIFELPGKRHIGIVEEVRNNFKTILHMDCILEDFYGGCLPRWAAAPLHSPLPSDDDEDYTSSEDDVDMDRPCFRNWRMP